MLIEVKVSVQTCPPNALLAISPPTGIPFVPGSYGNAPDADPALNTPRSLLTLKSLNTEYFASVKSFDGDAVLSVVVELVQ